MATKDQQKILSQVEEKGFYTTTSARSAKAAHGLAGQGVQHIYSSELPDAPGKTTHRFAKRQRCH